MAIGMNVKNILVNHLETKMDRGGRVRKWMRK